MGLERCYTGQIHHLEHKFVSPSDWNVNFKQIYSSWDHGIEMYLLATIGKRNGSDSFSLFETAQNPLKKSAHSADINLAEECIKIHNIEKER